MVELPPDFRRHIEVFETKSRCRPGHLGRGWESLEAS